MKRLRAALMQEVTDGGNSRGSEPVEAAARLVGLRILSFPPAGDPAGVLHSVKNVVDRRPRSLRSFQDCPAVQLGILTGRIEKDLGDIEERIGDPDRCGHGLILSRSANTCQCLIHASRPIVPAALVGVGECVAGPVGNSLPSLKASNGVIDVGGAAPVRRWTLCAGLSRAPEAAVPQDHSE